MKFTLANETRERYAEDFKPFQLNSVVVSANGFTAGYSDSFLSLIDTGAKNTSISSKIMKTILPVILDRRGQQLKPIGSVKSFGIFGKPRESLIYILPHFYLGKIHFTDLLVTVPETDNFNCVIGRSVLHSCITTFDPKTDTMHFDFDDELQQSRQTLLNFATFGSVELFAEFPEV